MDFVEGPFIKAILLGNSNIHFLVPSIKVHVIFESFGNVQGNIHTVKDI